MSLTEKERQELKREINEKYRDKKHGKFPRGITYGDISDDMCHSDRKELIDISNEIVKEK